MKIQNFKLLYYTVYILQVITYLNNDFVLEQYTIYFLKAIEKYINKYDKHIIVRFLAPIIFIVILNLRKEHTKDMDIQSIITICNKAAANFIENLDIIIINNQNIIKRTNSKLIEALRINNYVDIISLHKSIIENINKLKNEYNEKKKNKTN